MIPSIRRRIAHVPLIALLVFSACRDPIRQVTPIERIQIERTIRDEVVAAYDFTKPDVPRRLMALYAPEAHIISASGGRVITNRDSLSLGIQAFWTNVGRNMRNPTMEWTAVYIEVLSPTAAAMTARYRIPHKTPRGLPHVIGGAWTAVFEKIQGKWLIVQEHLSDDPHAR